MRQKFITKCFRFLIQNPTVLLQLATVIKNVPILLQNATVITNCKVHYKICRYTGSSRLCYIDEIKSTELYVGSIGVLQVEIHIIFLSIFISFILNQSQFHFQFHLFYLEVYLFPFFISQKVLTTSPQFNFLIRLELMSNFNYLGHTLL